ncbi:hypothetical protein FALB51S_04490 [Frigidibacter albus]
MHTVIDRADKAMQRAGQGFGEIDIAHAQLALGKADAVIGGGDARRRHAPVDRIQRHGQREEGIGAGFHLFFDGIAVQVDQAGQDQVALHINLDPARRGIKGGNLAVLDGQRAMVQAVRRHDAGIGQGQGHSAASSNALRVTVIF